MPQPTLGSPLHEPYLRHQLRLHPLHPAHLVGRCRRPRGQLDTVFPRLRVQGAQALDAEARKAVSRTRQIALEQAVGDLIRQADRTRVNEQVELLVTHPWCVRGSRARLPQVTCTR